MQIGVEVTRKAVMEENFTRVSSSASLLTGTLFRNEEQTTLVMRETLQTITIQVGSKKKSERSTQGQISSMNVHITCIVLVKVVTLWSYNKWLVAVFVDNTRAVNEVRIDEGES